jgi:hypothetical protein
VGLKSNNEFKWVVRLELNFGLKSNCDGVGKQLSIVKLKSGFDIEMRYWIQYIRFITHI